MRQRVSSGALPAVAVTAEQALGGDHDAELVVLEGQLIGQDESASDPTIVLSSGKYVFSVVLPAQSEAKRWAAWKKGTVFKIIGICSVKDGTERTGGQRSLSVPRSFQVLLRSAQDLVVIKSPSWWTPTHAVAALGVVAVLTLVVLPGCLCCVSKSMSKPLRSGSNFRRGQAKDRSRK